jgi:hypothetical protein
MSETRKLKMKIGDAEFEADVPENLVQPMYDRFLSILERQRTALFRKLDTAGKSPKKTPEITEPVRGSIETVVRSSATNIQRETSDRTGLTRIFDLREDGIIILKVLPKGPHQYAEALLLLLYGYYHIKNEERVMAIVLNRAAQQSGIPLHKIGNWYKKNGRYVVRGGLAKGSNYSLNSDGLAIAKEILAKIFELCASDLPQLYNDAGPHRERAILAV